MTRSVLVLAILMVAVGFCCAADAQRLEQAFAAGDGNRDSVLDRGEVDGLVTAMHLGGRGLMLDTDWFMDRYDGDGDGVISRVELGLPADAPAAINDAVPAGITVTTNVPYATIAGVDPSLLSLDIYAPENAANAPVLVYVHGGGWSIGDRSRVHHKPAWLTGRGWILVSINYRLSPAVQHPAHIQDVAAAIAWVHGHIANHGGDPGRIAVMGHSAGAHLTALVGLDPRWLAAHGIDHGDLLGLVLLDGAGYDIPDRMGRAGRRMRDMIHQAFTEDPAVWADASPRLQAAAGAPPCCITYAGSRWEAQRQANALQQTLQGLGVRVEVHAIAGKNHQQMNEDLGVAGDPLTVAVDVFLSSVDTAP